MTNPLELAPVLPGETFAGKYRVERVLGHGGMGIVVAARHLELEERVAVKFLLRKDDPSAVERFMREARASAKVKSEHVCRVYDVGRLESGEPYLVMEYLDGLDLADKLRASKRLRVADVAGWMIEACSALADAHALGIVHRDLKPANVFLARRSDETAVVKVLDFGISKIEGAHGMTSTSAVMGTPVYMSPEQVASSKDVDHRTDIWSLGVIMYELVSGKQPFRGDSLIQLSVRIREADVEPLASGEAGFDAVVAKCLAKEPAERWSSVAELASALAPFAGGASRALAVRAARTLTTAKSALAETMPDDRSPSRPDPEGGQATLEPLSTARRPSLSRPASRSPRLAILGVAAFVIGGAAVARLAASAPEKGTETRTLGVDVEAEPALAPSSAAASAEPLPRSPSPPKAPADAPAPARLVVAKPAAVASAGVVVVPDAAPPPASVTPAEATSVNVRKARPLDRDDPYGP